jgi:2-keto-4-pentenoate hydratase/2-oxohepta-3-ene-1,7-dioic acid hydratase in catechol pathway
VPAQEIAEMKLISYRSKDGQDHIGALIAEAVIDLEASGDQALPTDMLSLLQGGDAAFERAAEEAATSSETIDIDSVKLLAPVPNPSKVIAIGLNYMDHIRETGLPMPRFPTMFCKYPSSIIASGEPIRWSSGLTRQVDFEAELAVVIGKTARNVAEADAYDYIAGYMNCNDVSARDLQFREGDQWLRGKCLDSFCPLGPCLVTRDEIPDPHRLAIRCTVNGEIMQESNTSEMIYRIPYLIAYLSEAFTLLPGDIIATGTPHGVGAFRKPPVWLQSGDIVGVEIEGIGLLVNPCVADS